jgi:hypothetical protein
MTGRARLVTLEVLMPLLVLAGYVVTRIVAGGGADFGLRVAAPTAAQALSVVGCVLAARAFEPGAHLRRVWTLLAISGGGIAVQYALGLLPRDLLVDSLRLGTTAVVNLSSAWGLWLLARTIHVAGLAPPGGRFGRGFALAVTFVVAATVAGPGWIVSVHSFLGAPGPAAARPVIGGAVDIFAMVLIAPVGLTAVALRGGTLSRPWTLLALNSLCFLLLNLAGITARLVPADTQRALQLWVFDPLLLVAPLLYFGAAWAQLRVARGQASQSSPVAAGER